MLTMDKPNIVSAVSAPRRVEPDPVQTQTPPALAAIGRIEMLSTEFAIGWASVSAANHHAHVFAMVGSEIIGFGPANISRPDLDRARQEGQLNAYAFILVFDRPVNSEQTQSIKIFIAGQAAAIPEAKQVKIDRSPTLRLFVMGSPRSGTSQLGQTLAQVLSLPWLGEGHGAPLFASAADALAGDIDDKNGISRFMALQDFRQIAIEAAKKAYFYLHGSASFIDKTPGIKMISAAPFLNQCFPGSRFIFLRRNPVNNIMSRMAKFGGSFDNHCMDWTGAMNAWLKVRSLLPHFVEIQQEDMLQSPDQVGKVLAEYIGLPEIADRISQSIKKDSLERTGAGDGGTDQLRAAWTPEQSATFEKICRPVMRTFGYK